MKATLEITDPLFRKAKAVASAQGQTLKELVNEALRDKLMKPKQGGEPAWMKFFGAMRDHPEQRRRIDSAVEESFERIDPEVWK